LSPKLSERLALQYRQHPNWSYQLHLDNLAVLIEKEPSHGAVPSYASVLRFMKVHGLIKRPRRGPVHSPGARTTEHRIEAREIRSYESEYVNALWHLDFHQGSLRVLLDKGRWVCPLMLGIIDDHSRLTKSETSISESDSQSLNLKKVQQILNRPDCAVYLVE
jgi:putative transposase